MLSFNALPSGGNRKTLWSIARMEIYLRKVERKILTNPYSVGEAPFDVASIG